MDCLYQGYRIESVRGRTRLWHARIRRADQTPDHHRRHAFPTLEVGFAWDDPDAAIDDAKHHIDRFKHRWEQPRMPSGRPDQE